MVCNYLVYHYIILINILHMYISYDTISYYGLYIPYHIALKYFRQFWRFSVLVVLFLCFAVNYVLFNVTFLLHLKLQFSHVNYWQFFGDFICSKCSIYIEHKNRLNILTQKKMCSHAKIIIPDLLHYALKSKFCFFRKIYSSRSEKWTFSECPFFETSTISFLKKNTIE